MNQTKDVPPQKYNPGQHVCWQGRGLCDGLIKAASWSGVSWYYKIHECWVEEALLTPVQSEPATTFLGVDPALRLGDRNAVCAVRFDSDGTVWLNPALDLTQVRALPRETLIALKAVVDAALGPWGTDLLQPTRRCTACGAAIFPGQHRCVRCQCPVAKATSLTQAEAEDEVKPDYEVTA